MSKLDAFSKNARRLKGYDYRQESLYFITICTKDRCPYFGEVVNGEMVLSDEGHIAHDYWLDLPKHIPQIFLGEFVIMPNHVHGILGIEGKESAGSSLGNDLELSNNVFTGKNQFMATLAPKAGSISHIIGFYKATCTKMIRSVSTEPFGWQPRFHDRIIRNQQELMHIENYILANPGKWQEDQFFQP